MDFIKENNSFMKRLTFCSKILNIYLKKNKNLLKAHFEVQFLRQVLCNCKAQITKTLIILEENN